MLEPVMTLVVDWVQANAIPLSTVETGRGFADLERLRGIIGDARIVSLGEATHGTREFFHAPVA
jgi:erythromycin esterase